jgi:hypothetical protein
MFRALQPPEAPGSRGVLASRASAGQSEAVGSGIWTGWEGVAAWGQALCSRSNDRAGDRGRARAGKPRWVRILAMTEGCSMAVMIFKGPPQWGQCWISILNTRLSSRASSGGQVLQGAPGGIG